MHPSQAFSLGPCFTFELGSFTLNLIRLYKARRSRIRHNRPDYVHIIPTPDVLRGRNLDGGAAARVALGRVHAAGGRVCAFFSESILSCGGQVRAVSCICA